MLMKKEQTAVRPAQDPFTVLRRMTSELDRFFDEPFSFGLGSPFFSKAEMETPAWAPRIEVFEKDHRLVTKVDLPGMKKDDVKVEVSDGQLAISGERKRKTEEKDERTYRCEREYGSFYRAVPLPEGVKLDEIKATFADGVLVLLC